MTTSEMYLNYAKYNAWYTGNTRALRAAAGHGSFWGSSAKQKMHVPIAAELAEQSGNLLFGQPPNVYSFAASSQGRLEYILEQSDFFENLYAGAERAAALGDMYIKINWDTELLDCPIVSFVPAECAYAEYVQGIAVGYHFFTVKEENGEKLTWVYEYYTRGSVTTKLYTGTKASIEKKIYESTVETGIDAVLAVHIPNILPNKESCGNFGQSDIADVIPLMDALDETYSSWLRDMRLAKARLIVPMEYMRLKPSVLDSGSQKVFHFDKEDDLYVAMDIDSSQVHSPITLSQFTIRSNEHKLLANELLERIISCAGYSPQTFGLEIRGTAQSGTALSIRERKTFVTKSKKELCFKGRLQKFLGLVLAADNVIFGKSHLSTKVSVEIKGRDGYLGGIAETVNLLNSAGAVSTYTKVQVLHPDWDDATIREEVLKIQTEG